MRSLSYLFGEGFKSLWKNRTMSAASIAVLISCLLLTGIAIAVSVNMENTMKSIEGDNNISIYIDTEVSTITSIEIGETIRSISNVDTCEYISKDDGLEDLKDLLGENSSLLEGLDGDDNFLPDAYSISLEDLSLYEDTMNQIIAIEGVKSYTDYSDVAEKLSSLDELITYASIAIVSLLAVVSIFIISNTVKVTMFTRRVEINIMKSVGATNWFVRIPFVVESLIIGLISGGLSATILFFAYDKATQVVYGIVPFLSIVDIDPYMWYIYGVYAVLGALFGVVGGAISISRYLKNEGQNAII
ncbi:MAG: permease-like cell division protein FtsX [Clostridia bacterium]